MILSSSWTRLLPRSHFDECFPRPRDDPNVEQDVIGAVHGILEPLDVDVHTAPLLIHRSRSLVEGLQLPAVVAPGERITNALLPQLGLGFFRSVMSTRIPWYRVSFDAGSLS